MNQARENTSFTQARLPNPPDRAEPAKTAQVARELCYYPAPHHDISGVAV